MGDGRKKEGFTEGEAELGSKIAPQKDWNVAWRFVNIGIRLVRGNYTENLGLSDDPSR